MLLFNELVESLLKERHSPMLPNKPISIQDFNGLCHRGWLLLSLHNSTISIVAVGQAKYNDIPTRPFLSNIILTGKSGLGSIPVSATG